jgi:hypothetical protein
VVAAHPAAGLPESSFVEPVPAANASTATT